MKKQDVLEILRAVESGRLGAEEAFTKLKLAPFEDIGFAKVDHHREMRQGVAEVIYGAGKTKEQILGIARTMLQNGQQTVLITRLCREAGVPFVLDASQSAGVLDVDMSRLGAEFIAMPGHKGLLGPQGTGVLLCREGAKPLMAGGTGSESRSQTMPDFLPDMLEAGTHNIPGIAGLMAGAEFVRTRGVESIGAHERGLLQRLARALESVPELEVFASKEPSAQSGVLSVRHPRIGSEELGAELGRRGVCVRAGLHCAPLAHESAGTIENGTVRLSFSPFNSSADADRAAAQLRASVKSLLDD